MNTNYVSLFITQSKLVINKTNRNQCKMGDLDAQQGSNICGFVGNYGITSV